jgi:protein involved in polysaccharide export with SLBB domain
MAQGSYVFSEKDDYLDYINMSGGYSDYADESNIFILKVDGSARKAARRSLISWKRTFSDEETNYIEPGDVIVVPEKIERIAWLREVRDITQILMNTAVVAGVVKVLF